MHQILISSPTTFTQCLLTPIACLKHFGEKLKEENTVPKNQCKKQKEGFENDL
jgi:hypothetical protein